MPMTTAQSAALPGAVTESAPAKVNLALHVTGRRQDGYHLLDSLVVFAGPGDMVSARPAESWSLSVIGPRAGAVPAGDDNLVLRAARAMGGDPAALVLDKHLPAAGGIGGGSAEAAAAMRALHRLDGRPYPADRGLSIGADVPVCLMDRAARMRGVGEIVDKLPPLPRFALCLVNPGRPLGTPEVFGALDRRDNPGLTPMPARWRDAEDLAGWLRDQRNDLEAPARALVPEIGDALAEMAAQPGCLLARMSGSGATCFGLFAEIGAAQQARRAMEECRGWWARAMAPQLTRETA